MTRPSVSVDSTNSPPAFWTESDSIDFLDFGSAFIPERDNQHQIICAIAAAFVKNGRLLELCCGSGELARLLLDLFPDIHLDITDQSPAMLDAAKKQCANHSERVAIIQSDLSQDEIPQARGGYDVIASSLAIHHLEHHDKQGLFRKIHGALRPGGAFVYADMTMPLTSLGLDIAAQQWEESVRGRSLSLYGDTRAMDRFNDLKWNFYRDPAGDPSDKPASIIDIIQWLHHAEFSTPEIHFLKAAHIVLSAVKPE